MHPDHLTSHRRSRLLFDIDAHPPANRMKTEHRRLTNQLLRRTAHGARVPCGQPCTFKLARVRTCSKTRLVSSSSLREVAAPARAWGFKAPPSAPSLQIVRTGHQDCFGTRSQRLVVEVFHIKLSRCRPSAQKNGVSNVGTPVGSAPACQASARVPDAQRFYLKLTP